MKHVSILVPHGQFSIVNIAGSFQILNWASNTYLQQHGKALFSVEFVGASTPSADQDGLFTVFPARTLASTPQTDLIILPAVHGSLQEVVATNIPLVQWISQQYKTGAEVAAFFIGVFLLAATGILNGKSCSTHWGQAEELQRRYPAIEVQSEKIVTECEGVYTSGGAYSFTNLLLYLIEKYGGRELSILTAKAFMLDIDKHDQSVFMVFNGQKEHGDPLVERVQQYIERHFAEKLVVSDLAAQYATTRRTLERRFKRATDNSVLEYLQRVRIEGAKRQLESGGTSVTEAMYTVGYNDTKAFRGVFKKYAGLSPAQYRKKFLQPQKVAS